MVLVPDFTFQSDALQLTASSSFLRDAQSNSQGLFLSHIIWIGIVTLDQDHGPTTRLLRMTI